MTPSVKKALERLDGNYRMIGSDVDSIKHFLRSMRRQLDALLLHSGVNLAPDSLDEIVNPSDSFINTIVAEARFAGLGEVVSKHKKKRKARKKRL